MIDAPNSLDAYFNALVAEHRDLLYKAIRSNDRSLLETYADHVKCTKGNVMTNNIKARYP